MATLDEKARQEGSGEVLAAISRSIVQLMRAGAGKGPTRCRTFWVGNDAMLVLLGGGFSAAERTLRAAGRSEEVLAARRALQAALEPEMRAVVEATTGRRVRAFMSSTEVDAELSAEIFIFEPDAESDALPG